MPNDAIKVRYFCRISRGRSGAIASIIDAGEAARRCRGNRSPYHGVWVFAFAIMGCGQPSIGGGSSPSSDDAGSAGGANTDGGATESQACVYHQQSTFDCGTGNLPVTSTLCSDGSSSLVGPGEGLAVGGCTSVNINSDLTPIPGSCATWDHKFPGEDDAGNGATVNVDAGLRDCPPCWQELFCWVPPDLGDNFLMLGASDGEGGCTLTPELDSGESISVPLECGGPSNTSVPWSTGMHGADVTIIFSIPSKGIVNCVKS